MRSFRESQTWLRTLEDQGPNDPHSEARGRLRNALLLMAEGAAQIAAEIKRDLKDFTRHDSVHHDALWHLVDLIAGPNLEVLPSEAFVFGVAVLLHDLGLGLAAYPDRLDSLRRGTTWADAVALAYRSHHGRSAS